MTSPDKPQLPPRRAPAKSDAEAPPLTDRAPKDAVPEVDDTITEKLVVDPREPIRDQATLTLLTGNSAGKVFKLAAEKTVLGRGKEVHIKIVDNGVSRQHARIIRWVGMAFVVEDLGSMNGTYINGRRVERASISNGDRLQLGPSAQLRFALSDKTESTLQDKISDGLSREPATDVYTRQHMTRQIRLELAYGRRHDSDVAIVLMKVVGYAELLKERGDSACAEVFQHFAARVAECGRIEDLVARYDDDALAVLLRATAPDAAVLYANRVLDRALDALGRDGAKVTLRIGIATMSELPAETGPDEMVRLAELRVEHAARHDESPICNHARQGRD